MAPTVPGSLRVCSSGQAPPKGFATNRGQSTTGGLMRQNDVVRDTIGARTTMRYDDPVNHVDPTGLRCDTEAIGRRVQLRGARRPVAFSGASGR